MLLKHDRWDELFIITLTTCELFSINNKFLVWTKKNHIQSLIFMFKNNIKCERKKKIITSEFNTLRLFLWTMKNTIYHRWNAFGPNVLLNSSTSNIKMLINRCFTKMFINQNTYEIKMYFARKFMFKLKFSPRIFRG